MNNPCDCITSSYFPHRTKNCGLRKALGLLPYTQEEIEEADYQEALANSILEGQVAEQFSSYENHDATKDVIHAIPIADAAKVLANSVSPEAELFRGTCYATPVNERIESAIPVKSSTQNMEVHASICTELSRDCIVIDKTIDCHCNLSTFFPHKEYNCEVINERANLALKGVGLAIGTAAVTAIAASYKTDNSKKSNDKKK